MQTVVSRLLRGEWVESETLEEVSGMTFGQLLKSPYLEHSRTAEWNPHGNGQIIKNFFRITEVR